MIIISNTIIMKKNFMIFSFKAKFRTQKSVHQIFYGCRLYFHGQRFLSKSSFTTGDSLLSNEIPAYLDAEFLFNKSWTKVEHPCF